jgi:AraC family transcriptional regulator
LFRKDAIVSIDELYLAQEDGNSPTIVTAGSAPGESGVSVLGFRFDGGAHFSGTVQQHLLCFQTSPQVRFDCRLADRALQHEPAVGSLAICPAGIDGAADADGSFDGILVSVDPGRFALAAAEEDSPEAQVVERFSGRDPVLLELARILASESGQGYPNGALFWNDVASAFIGNLLARHTSESDSRARGALGKDAFKRLREYIVAHLDQPIEVEALAALAGRSLFHFSRVFTRSVGMTPYRYVVHLRLQRAIELVRDGGPGLAEIAAQTGFADQSHLSRWVRRVYGVSPSQLAD